MPFRLGFKSILLLLVTLSLSNLLFVDLLVSFGFSQPMSLSICTTVAITFSMTIIMIFTKQIEKERKKKILPYFAFFLVMGIAISFLAIY